MRWNSQLFRSKIPYCFTFWSLALVGLPEQSTIRLLWLCLSRIEGEGNVRSFERSELERKCIFLYSWLFVGYCDTPLGVSLRVSWLGFFFFVLKALQNIIASFCSRFPLTFLRPPPTRPFNSFSNRRELGIAESVRRILLVSARELSSLVSKIISAGVVFGDISRFTTRYCYISVESSQDWDSKFIWINTVLGNLIFGEKIRHD